MSIVTSKELFEKYWWLKDPATQTVQQVASRNKKMEKLIKDNGVIEVAGAFLQVSLKNGIIRELVDKVNEVVGKGSDGIKGRKNAAQRVVSSLFQKSISRVLNDELVLNIIKNIWKKLPNSVNYSSEPSMSISCSSSAVSSSACSSAQAGVSSFSPAVFTAKPRKSDSESSQASSCSSPLTAARAELISSIVSSALESDETVTHQGSSPSPVRSLTSIAPVSLYRNSSRPKRHQHTEHQNCMQKTMEKTWRFVKKDTWIINLTGSVATLVTCFFNPLAAVALSSILMGRWVYQHS